MLRPYQKEAISALRASLKPNFSPVVVLPTGGGKGFIMSEIAKGCVKKGSRLLILAHVKELVAQNAKQAQLLLDNPSQVGIVSAGLKRKDLDHPIISAGIQSIYKRACDIGKVDVIMCDECHLVRHDDAGMYRQFLKEARVVNPNLLIAGLTATPYRMDGGMIYGEDDNKIFDEPCYKVSVLDLINDGYLSPLRSKIVSVEHKPDFSNLHTRAGEFVQDEVDMLMGGHEFIVDSVADMVAKCKTAGRKSILAFCSSVANADRTAEEIQEQTGEAVEIITGATPNDDRAKIIDAFKMKEIKWLVNVSVLTTGFDAPAVDCVAIFRPTKSPGLFYQMVGRGFRIADGKTDCLVLDYGENIQRHGPVDLLDEIEFKDKKKKKEAPPIKVCPNCGEICAISIRVCPSCSSPFPEPERVEPTSKSSDEAILSDQIEVSEHEVLEASYSIHMKKGTDGLNKTDFTIRVDYQYGIYQRASEWLCFNHEGFARRKAEKWWRQRSVSSAPDDVEQALALLNAGACCEPKFIRLRHVPAKKYPELVHVEAGTIDESWFYGKADLNKEPQSNDALLNL